ncbi:MAG: hypothetical protein ALMCE001_01300 [Methanocorpusculum sp. MCE]|nr:MAG: hypothetical protein ALMCE001_01300 [Methanocorpusculum sp. MCE]
MIYGRLATSLPPHAPPKKRRIPRISNNRFFDRKYFLFITFVICLVETKAAKSSHTYYSTYEKKVLSVGKKGLLEIFRYNFHLMII